MTVTLSETTVPQVEVSSAEADEDAGSLEFTVTLDAESSKTVEVAWGDRGGYRDGGYRLHRVERHAHVPAGLVERTLFVPLLNDDTYETNETLTLTLSAPVNAGFAGDATTLTATRHHRQRRRAAAAGRRAPVRRDDHDPAAARQQAFSGRRRAALTGGRGPRPAANGPPAGAPPDAAHRPRNADHEHDAAHRRQRHLVHPVTTAAHRRKRYDPLDHNDFRANHFGVFVYGTTLGRLDAAVPVPVRAPRLATPCGSARGHRPKPRDAGVACQRRTSHASAEPAAASLAA